MTFCALNPIVLFAKKNREIKIVEILCRSHGYSYLYLVTMYSVPFQWESDPSHNDKNGKTILGLSKADIFQT